MTVLSESVESSDLTPKDKLRDAINGDRELKLRVFDELDWSTRPSPGEWDKWEVQEIEYSNGRPSLGNMVPWFRLVHKEDGERVCLLKLSTKMDRSRSVSLNEAKNYPLAPATSLWSQLSREEIDQTALAFCVHEEGGLARDLEHIHFCASLIDPIADRLHEISPTLEKVSGLLEPTPDREKADEGMVTFRLFEAIETLVHAGATDRFACLPTAIENVKDDYRVYAETKEEHIQFYKRLQAAIADGSVDIRVCFDDANLNLSVPDPEVEAQLGEGEFSIRKTIAGLLNRLWK